MKYKHIRQNLYISDAKRFGIYFAAYTVLLMLGEIIAYASSFGFIDMKGWIFLFIPAEAAVLATLSGWFSNEKVGRIVDIVVVMFPTIYYISQVVYFNIFKSVYSISMTGMGVDAVENFSWGMGSVLREGLWVSLLLLLPAAVLIVGRFLFFKEAHYRARSHGFAAIIAVVLWLLAMAILPLGGKDDFSVYHAYHSSFVDTDTAASKIGILTNSAVETGRMVRNLVFGTDGGNGNGSGDNMPVDEDLEPVDIDDIPVEDPEKKEDEPVLPTIDTSPNIIKEFDFDALAEIAKNKNAKAVCEYASKQKGTKKNEYTGIFADYNLIYICAESFSNYAVDPVITPTLWKLANEGIVLDNYYNSFKNTTTNGEFSFLTSLWPDVSRYAKLGTNKGSFAQTANNSMPMGIGKLFTEQKGIVSHGYHNYLGSYYCRDKTLPNLGFECKFMNKGMKFSTSWPTSDLEMMEQSIDDYINDDQFFAYYMTFSGHGPYDKSNIMYRRNIDAVEELIGDRKLNDVAVGYFATNYELEKAMKYLLDRLEEAGKLENTLIVLTGDHYPYYLSDSARNKIAGETVDTTFDIYKSTCTMWTAGIDTIHVSDCCCNVDILPTVLNLFGIEYDSRLIAGTDIFSDSIHVAMLYNKSYITDKVKYNSSNGKAIWAEDVIFNDSEKEKYAQAMLDYVSAKYILSLKIVDCDFYKFAWENTEFAPDEEEQ